MSINGLQWTPGSVAQVAGEASVHPGATEARR
jgi:hypothetical protein